jgi:Flp pilus assembly protein TadD
MHGNVNQFGFKAKKLTGMILVYAFLLSSCATTTTYDTQETIEITENYSVSEEVREEFGKAVVLMKAGKYEEAIQLLRAVTGKTSKFTSPYINLGIAYIATDQLDKAEQSLTKALKLNKTHPAANNEMALVYRKTGRFTEARQLYQEVLTRYPEFLPARKNLGVLCDLYLQDLKCALEQYEQYLNMQPEDKQVQIWVADVKQRM